MKIQKTTDPGTAIDVEAHRARVARLVELARHAVERASTEHERNALALDVVLRALPRGRNPDEDGAVQALRDRMTWSASARDTAKVRVERLTKVLEDPDIGDKLQRLAGLVADTDLARLRAAMGPAMDRAIAAVRELLAVGEEIAKLAAVQRMSAEQAIELANEIEGPAPPVRTLSEAAVAAVVRSEIGAAVGHRAPLAMLTPGLTPSHDLSALLSTLGRPDLDVPWTREKLAAAFGDVPGVVREILATWDLSAIQGAATEPASSPAPVTRLAPVPTTT